MIQVKIEEVKAAFDSLMEHLKSNGHESIDIDVDYYWDILKEERYNPYEDPKNFSMGQLSDDISELRRVLDGDSEPVTYGLVWLASVLRAIGEKVVA
jgi:hypothetical protein